jgi:hypothetical protein
VSGDIVATGSVFGAGALGELQSVAFKPVGWSPSPDHLFVYTATDQYTFGGGTFRIHFEASCRVVSFDEVEEDVTQACAGNWRVNGGTGEYGRLKGTGTFTETQDLSSSLGVGTGLITLVGNMHVD